MVCNLCSLSKLAFLSKNLIATVYSEYIIKMTHKNNTLKFTWWLSECSVSDLKYSDKIIF